MKKMLLFCCGLSFLAAMQAQVILVPADYPTIQQGINAANPGDTVLVDDGTYYEQINFQGKKPLMVASWFLLDGDVNHINNTIIDGSLLTDPDHASVVYFISGEDTTSILNGFTVRQGKGTAYAAQGTTYRAGGGVFISSSGAKITHCHITENHLSNTLHVVLDIADGAGIGCELKLDPHWVVVSNNVIDHNSCTSRNVGATGAGVSICYNSRIAENTISWNTCTGTLTAYASVAGISCSTLETVLSNVTAKVEHNVISNNYATAQNNQAHSSGVCFASVKGFFSDNLIENNEVLTSTAYFGGCTVLFWIPRQGSFARNNIFRYNTSNDIGALAIQTPSSDPNPQTVLVENNYFQGNIAKSGAALWADVNPVMLQNNVFSGNHAIQNGGAIFCSKAGGNSADHMLISVNNSFFGNKADKGGAIFTGLYTVKPLIMNTVLWGDTATQGSEIYVFYPTDTVEIAFSDFNPNSVTGHFRDGGKNANIDPLFTNFENLIPEAGSPVMDAGAASYTCANAKTYYAPEYDLLGFQRPWGTSPIDMGAYEFTDFTSLRPTAAGKTDIFPNPFTNSITISYTIGKAGPVVLQVFDSFGRLVAEPIDVFQQPGEQKVKWNSGNLPAGVYFCRLKAGDQIFTSKIIKIQ